MADDGLDRQADDLERTNPHIEPPTLPNQRRSVSGEVEVSGAEPQLAEISTVRVLSELAIKLERPNPTADGPALAAPPPTTRRAFAPALLGLLVVGLALAAWLLIRSG